MYEKLDHKEEVKTLFAEFDTSKGKFKIELFADKSPEAVWNFVNLAEGRQKTDKEGPYYDGVIFHRVIDGFMIQAGCPLGLGTGGPGYEFANEDHPELTHNSEGIVAMANRGKDTNGSQFYITLGAAAHLDGGYTIFGKVVDGIEIIKEIGKVEIDEYNGHKPHTDVVINSVKIIR